MVHQRTIRPYPKQQKDHNGRAQCSRIALSTTLSQDTGKTGGIMTGSPLRGGGVPPRGYHTNGRCEPTTKSPEKLLHSSKVHTVLRARMVPACAARAFTDRGSRPQVPHSGHRGRRSRRRANKRCGPTTWSPEELLHRIGDHITLRARMVPTCAARSYSGRGSTPQVTHNGHRGGVADGTSQIAAEGSPQKFKSSYCTIRELVSCGRPTWPRFAQRTRAWKRISGSQVPHCGTQGNARARQRRFRGPPR